MDTDSPGPRNGLRPRSTHLVVSAVIAATALVAGILILALVPDHRRPGVLTAVSVDEFLTADPAAAPAPSSPPTSQPPPSTPPSSPPPSTNPTPTRQQPTATPTATPAATPSITTVPPLPPEPPSAGRPLVTILNNSRENGLAERAKPLVAEAGFSVAKVANYRGKPGDPPGSVNLAKTTVFYEEGHEAYANDLRGALASKDGEGIEVKPNDGANVFPDGTLILVLTKHFSP